MQMSAFGDLVSHGFHAFLLRRDSEWSSQSVATFTEFSRVKMLPLIDPSVSPAPPTKDDSAKESPVSVLPEVKIRKDFLLGEHNSPDTSVCRFQSDSDVSSAAFGLDSSSLPLAEEIDVRGKPLDRRCLICFREFPTDADFARHQFLDHQQEKPFTCSTCAKRFSQRSTMVTHEKTVHGKQRDHKCDRCSSAFGQIGDLNRHKKTVHEGRRPHICDYCTQGFGIRSQLKKHVSTVHKKERPFSCGICPSSFGEKATLKKHIRARHGDIALDA